MVNRAGELLNVVFLSAEVINITSMPSLPKI